MYAGDHSFTHPAWLLAGESWAEAGKGEAAALAWRSAVKAAGDMREEALRRLLVQAFAEKDPARALAVADEALAGTIDGPVARAKLVYFRGRALALLGRGDEAKAAWLETLRAAPLDYPALQALSRLRELGDDAHAEGLGVLGREPDAKGDMAVRAADSERALLLARLGLGEEAAEELRIAGVDGWPAIAVLNDAGLFGRSQKLLASLGLAWRVQPPVGAARARWELAHPLPFEELIAPGESAHAVPPLLTFAVMQTESRFDPSAVSFAGARGLLQLMPETAATLAGEAGIELGADDRLHDPRVNLELGIRYLGRLAARWGGSDAAVALAVPSYNAGAGAVDRWIAERGAWDLDLFVESIPYDETRKYTQSVLGRWHAYRWLYGDAAPAERAPYLPLQLPARLR
jgi:soluble lytic murein transglycosylase